MLAGIERDDSVPLVRAIPPRYSETRCLTLSCAKGGPSRAGVLDDDARSVGSSVDGTTFVVEHTRAESRGRCHTTPSASLGFEGNRDES